MLLRGISRDATTRAQLRGAGCARTWSHLAHTLSNPTRWVVDALHTIRESLQRVLLQVELARHEGAAGLRPPDLVAALRGAGPLLDVELDEPLGAAPPRLRELVLSVRRLAHTARSETALVAAELAAEVDGPAG